MPTSDEMQAVWPKASLNEGGRAVLSCEVTSEGVAVDCSVVEEHPDNKGFGAAALQLTPNFLFKPALENGRPVASRARIPIDFKMEKTAEPSLGVAGETVIAMTGAPWVAAPTSADVAAVWPGKASADLDAGRVVLRCRLKRDGGLNRCVSLVEQPQNRGFVGAAFRLVNLFQVRVDGADPELVDKTLISIPFYFSNPARTTAAPEWIAKADWGRHIDPQAMVALYPEAAAKAGVKTGLALVECKVSIRGGLADCAAIDETPAGMGFGQAGVTAASQGFALNPWTPDGRPVDGAKIRIPIRFVEGAQPTGTSGG